MSKLFPERRVYIRSSEHTRYLAVSPVAQAGMLALVAAMLGWTGYATSAFVENALDGRAARIQLETVTEAYEARIAAYERQQTGLEEQANQADQRRDEITLRLSEKQARLVETANDLRAADGELEVLREEFETIVAGRRSDRERIDALESQLSEMQIALTEAETSKANLDGALTGLSSAIDMVIAERDYAAGKLATLDDQLARMHTKIGRYEDRQERLVSQLEEATQVSLAGLETLFSRLPIDLNAIMSQARRDFGGTGGLLEPAGEPDGETWEDDKRVGLLLQNLESVGLMRFAADRMPLGNPVPSGRKTSSFGIRRDPWRRSRARHNGQDLAAPRGTPVYATADGVVTFAGRRGGYGLFVKVRHAFGFETLYAHNSRLRVKAGQRVSRGDRIADVGSTGRSTGNHVHYEIRVGNRPINPSKFIEAPRNVL
ncbi:MAG: DUF5930 domain-containing protein [Paracoccaceae bacterium]|nr:DUF5930 domain-containing protein [Paracoccaceae bacterium]